MTDVSEEQIMNEVLSRLQKEQPKIDQSLKNLMSVMLGKYASLTIETKMKTITVEENPPSSSSASSKTDEPLLHTVFTKSTINIDHFNAKNLFAFAKLVLQVLQETELPPVTEFNLHFPQMENETAVEYLNRLIRYKGIYFLRQKLITENQKISKYFGKAYFLDTNVWIQMKEKIIEKAKTWTPSQCDLSTEEVEMLLSIYDKSINTPSRDFTAKDQLSDDHDDHSQYHALIWSPNFQETLQSIQQRRNERVNQRNEDKIVLNSEDSSEVKDV